MYSSLCLLFLVASVRYLRSLSALYFILRGSFFFSLTKLKHLFHIYILLLAVRFVRIPFFSTGHQTFSICEFSREIMHVTQHEFIRYNGFCSFVYAFISYVLQTVAIKTVDWCAKGRKREVGGINKKLAASTPMRSARIINLSHMQCKNKTTSESQWTVFTKSTSQR